jgi:hypothetical protein
VGPQVTSIQKIIVDKLELPDSMGFYNNNRKDNMTKEKTIKAEFLPGGAKRQELLEQVPEYLLKPGADQATKHMFCLEKLKLTETEYLEALNKATNGGLVEAAWN